MRKFNGFPYFLWDVLYVVLFLALFIRAFTDYWAARLYTPIFCIALGFAFLYSRKLSDLSKVEKGLYWFSQNVMWPRTGYNHIFGGFFLLLIGLLSLLVPDTHKIEDNEVLWNSLRKDPIFWISILVIVILNILIVVYRKTGARPKGSGRNMK